MADRPHRPSRWLALVTCAVPMLLAGASAAAAAPAATAAPPPAPTGVRIYLSTTDGIVPLDLRTRTVSPTIPLPDGFYRMVIADDGRTGWVLSYEEGAVHRVDLVRGTVGPAIAVGADPSTIALAVPAGSW